MPLVLYFTPDSKKGQQIAALCMGLGFRAKRLLPGDANKTVGALAGLKTAAGAAAQAPAGWTLPELLIFAEMTGDALDLFLAAYKNAGIASVSLKAVVTPHNTAWSLYALAEELKKERAAMLLYRKNQTKP
ncbi:MAG: DUF3783 domain-containing protein [Hominenteromicrobium sp.]